MRLILFSVELTKRKYSQPVSSKINVAIIGGGISGLSLGYYLKKKETNLKIFEKESFFGGVISSIQEKNCTFIKGPKTFKLSRAESLLELIKELGCEDDLIYSHKCANRRYIYSDKSFHEISFSLFHLFKDPWMRRIFFSLLKEPFRKKGEAPDESIKAFGQRRFGDHVTDYLLDPFVKGICGASIDKLSTQSTFPRLKEWENRYGSLIKGALFSKKGKGKGLFSLHGGLYTLIQKMEKNLSSLLAKNHEVMDVKKLKEGYEIKTSSGIYQASKVYSLLQPRQMKQWTLFSNWSFNFFERAHYESLVSVSFCFKGRVTPLEGFGYLVPTVCQEPIMGVMFDSLMFEGINKESEQLTVMLGGVYMLWSDEALVELCLKTLERHLGITSRPLAHQVFRYKEALCSYPVGLKKELEEIDLILEKDYPGLYLAGNFRHPPGVNECIKYIKNKAEEQKTL